MAERVIDRQELLDRIKRNLEDLYSDRLKGVVLYGSEARGESRPDSDIDILVLLEGPVCVWRERNRIINALYDVQLQVPQRHLSLLPLDLDEYSAQEFALLRNARREGVLL